MLSAVTGTHTSLEHVDIHTILWVWQLWLLKYYDIDVEMISKHMHSPLCLPVQYDLHYKLITINF